MNYINLQLFGGGGGSSGGNSRFTGHKMPNTGKPNSTRTKYDSQGKKLKKENMTRKESQKPIRIITMIMVTECHINITGVIILKLVGGKECHLGGKHGKKY